MTVAASVVAPHVCLVLSLPQPPHGPLFCPGHTHLAADLFSPSRDDEGRRQHRAAGGLRGGDAALAAAESPLMVLQSSRRKLSQNNDWEASVAIPQVKVRRVLRPVLCEVIGEPIKRLA